MALSGLPAAVAARLRDQVAAFGDRVAVAANEQEATDDTELSVPHAFYLPGGTEEGDVSISDLTQEMPIRFRILLVVANTADARGGAGTALFLAQAAAVMQALVGWAPLADFAGCVCEGIEDDFTSTRALFAGTIAFRTSAALSDL